MIPRRAWAAVPRFLLSAFAATLAAGATAGGVQRWMTFEIVSVEEGGSWLFGGAAVLAIGLATAALIGLPVRALVARVPPLARRSAIAFPLLAAAIATILFRAVNDALAPTLSELALVLLVSLVFFTVQHVTSARREAAAASPPEVTLEPGPRTRELLAALDELAPLLGELGHPHWEEWVAESARQLRSGDASGLRHLLGAYGGMGSFSDVLLAEDDPRAVRAAELRTTAWQIAKEIGRGFDLGSIDAGGDR